MPDAVRELLVSLSFNSGNAEGDVKNLGQAVRQAEANFNLAAAGLKGFEKTTAGLKAKVEQLRQTQELQSKTVQKYADQVSKHTAKLDAARKGEAKLSEAVKTAEAAYKAAAQAKGRDAEETQKLGKELDQARAAYAKNEKAMVNAAKAINKNELAHTQAQTAVKKTAAELKTAEEDLDKYGNAWGQMMLKVEKGAAAVGKTAQKVGGLATRYITAPVVTLGTLSNKAFIDYQSDWTGVTKTVEFESEQQEEAVRKSLMGMTELIPSTNKEILSVAESAGQLGIATKNIASFTRTIIDLENSTDLTDSASQFAQYANITQMQQDKFSNLGSTVVDLGNNYATTESKIMAMMMRTAAAGKQVGLTDARIAALSTTLSSLGIEAEAGGTAASKVLLNMDMAAAKGEKHMSSYAKVAGVSAKEFVAAWKRDPAMALDSFIQGLGRIKAEGGNVAQTLENMGYKEARTRDMLLRLAGAGDLLSRTLGTADSAWASNTALANEAQKRYDTTASKLQILKNKVNNVAISFGETMNPHLLKAVEAVGGLVDGFKNLDPAGQQTVLTLAAIAAAGGPVISSIGKISTGLSALSKVMVGPSGWVIAGVAAFAALGYAIATAETDVQKLDKALKNVEFTVDAGSAATIAQAIEDGLAAAEVIYSVKVKAQADTSEIWSQIDKVFADNKVTAKEYTAMSAFVTKSVAPDIKKAKNIVDAAVLQYQKSLDNAVNAKGQPLSKEEKQTLADEYRAKNEALLSELQGAEDQYKALIEQLKANGGVATEQWLNDMNDVLDKVEAIKIALGVAKDEATAALQADYNLTVTGQGNDTSVGGAIAYVKGQEQAAIVAAEKQLQADKAAATSNDEVTAAYNRRAEAIAAANAEAEKGYKAILEGEAERLGVDGSLAWLSKLGDYVDEAQTALDGLDASNAAATIQQLFGDGGALSQFKEGLSLFDQDVIDSLFRVDPDTVSEAMAGDAESILRNVLALLKSDELQITAGDDMDPMTTLFQKMFDLGAFDPASIDMTKVDGALEGMLSLIDVTDKGKDFGYDFTDGIGAGFEEKQDEAKTKSQAFADEATKAFDDGEKTGTNWAEQTSKGFVNELKRREKEAFRAGFSFIRAGIQGGNAGGEIASPSKASARQAAFVSEGWVNKLKKLEKDSFEAGRAFSAATIKGMDEVHLPSAGLLAGALQSINRSMGGSRGRDAASVINQRTINAPTNLHADNIILQNDLDVQALEMQLNGHNRRRLVGYGAKV